MDRPVCDFVKSYNESGALRLHMPGHKGRGPLGFEGLDITEFDGADSLYEASGILARSEENASRLFGAKSFYSAEGSSLCVKAMLYLALLQARKQGRRPLVAAGRNSHNSFLRGAALLGLDVEWLWPEGSDYLACPLTAEALEDYLIRAEELPAAVYVTSPDYLGNCLDIAALSAVCRRYETLFLVDNAHGAYLRFLPKSRHPMDLGADMCCDSAHKTLPVLTGGAYLHISPRAPEALAEQAKSALALFGSTSPSYLILQSLDAVNPCLEKEFPEALAAFVPQAEALKERLRAAGFALWGEEPMKLCLCPKSYGWRGQELARALMEKGIYPEFYDADHVVLMLSPQTGDEGLARLEGALLGLERRVAIEEEPPAPARPERVMSLRQAMLAPRESIPAAESLGRVLAEAGLSCPPAVPIVAGGERIDEKALAAFRYYGVERCTVVME